MHYGRYFMYTMVSVFLVSLPSTSQCSRSEIQQAGKFDLFACIQQDLYWTECGIELLRHDGEKGFRSVGSFKQLQRNLARWKQTYGLLWSDESIEKTLRNALQERIKQVRDFFNNDALGQEALALYHQWEKAQECACLVVEPHQDPFDGWWFDLPDRTSEFSDRLEESKKQERAYAQLGRGDK